MRALAILIFLITNFIVWGGLTEVFRGEGTALFAWLLLFPLSFVAALAHEAGHAAAVRALGGRIIAFAVAPFELRFSPLRIGSMQLGPSEVGGYVIGETRHQAGYSRREAIIVAAAGPAANLVLAALAAFASVGIEAARPVYTTTTTTIVADNAPRASPQAFDLRLPSDEQVEASLARYQTRQNMRYLGRIAAVLGWLSLGLGLANLVPFRNSDGAAIRDALRRGYT